MLFGSFDLDRFAMTRNGSSHKLLLGIWLLFCGGVVAGLLFVIGWVGGHAVDPLLALLVGVAAIPFVWMLSSGWEDADLFKKALRTYVKEHEKRDA
jgi:urea transporter